HPVLLHERERERREIPTRRAIPRGFQAQHPLERPHAAREAALFTLGIVGLGPLVEIAVMADLVASVADHLGLVGILLGHPAGNEERRGPLRGAQQIEQPRDADVWAIASL